MNITPEEARAALNDIRRLTDKTQSTFNTGAYYWLLWGIIWTVGFFSSQWFPQWIGWIWLSMLVVGIAGCSILGIMQSRHIRVVPGSRSAAISINAVFTSIAILAFGIVWLRTFSFTPTQVGILWIMLIMLNTIICGIWLREKWAIVFGVIVTVMNLVGYFLLPHYFWLWATVFAGLPLVGLSLYWLRKR